MSDTSAISTQVIEGAHPRFELEGAELKVTSGPDRGLVIKLGGDSLLIGTHPQCEVVLHDATVSKRHAEVAVTPRGYFLRDLGSTNGVTVGALPIVKVALVDRLRFSLGATTITVRALRSRTSLPLSRPGRFGGLIAHSVKMRAVVASLQQLATSDVTVLIEGETGTGKEVAAEALHRHSARAQAPFLVLDCGAVQPALFASDLYGHERGAFTGATAERAGLLEQADGGTLFIDEIAELPLELQTFLLGAFERQRARRLGGRREISYDVRFIAATNRNLAEEVRAGRFRQDLYYRIAGARVRLPPLRERAEDLPTLIDELAAEVGVGLTPEARALLATYEWPGNVRELRNTVASLVGRGAQDESLQARSRDRFIFDGDELRPLPLARRLSGDDFERRYVEAALRLAGRSVGKAAELAQVSRRFLSRLLAKHGLGGPAGE